MTQTGHVAPERPETVIPETGAPELPRPKVKKKRIKQSALVLEAFQAAQVNDPFYADNVLKLELLEHGLMELLNIQNVDELRALCGALGIPEVSHYTDNKEAILQWVRDYGKGAVVDYVRARKDFKERAYMEVLQFMWEGTLFEYLRSKGSTMRQCNDPKRAIIRYWLEGTRDIKALFTPMYIERKVRMREELDLSEDISQLMHPIEQNELLVKKAEARMRAEHDFRNVLLYLSAMSVLRTLETRTRDYMIKQITKLRGQADHHRETMDLVKQQTLELEERHEALCETSAKRLGHEEDMCQAYTNAWSDATADNMRIRELTFELLGEKMPKVAKVEGEVPGPNEESEKDMAGALPEDSDRIPTDVLMEMCRQRYMRHMGRLTVANRAMKRRVVDALDELEVAKDTLAKEAKRAEAAEALAQDWMDKYDALSEFQAFEIGTLRAESDTYFAMASDYMTENWMCDKRHKVAQHILEQMLISDDQQQVSKGAQLMEVLGLMTREQILERCEHATMRKEEIQQRQHEMLQLVKAQIVAAKKGKKKKGGKKGGKKK